jgi:hypothetical protein
VGCVHVLGAGVLATFSNMLVLLLIGTSRIIADQHDFGAQVNRE